MAAVMVVLHHAGSSAQQATDPARTGRLLTFTSVFDGGVAVFFVMSGFLLWRPMVVRSLDGERVVAPLGFWWRRILRIVPAYWATLTILWVTGALDLGPLWWRYYLFLQVYASETALGGIVVAWSLCTEMAFYLVLPALGAVIAALARRRSTVAAVWVQLACCGVLWLSGFGFRALMDGASDQRRGLSFMWLPQNLDLFAMGMAIAVVSAATGVLPTLATTTRRLARRTWPWWSAAVALFSWYAIRVGPTDLFTGYRGWFWSQRQLVLGVTTALLLIPVVFDPEGGGALRRLASWRPIVWVGLVSYGLYLWHLDILDLLMKHNTLGFADLVRRGASNDPATLVLFVTGLAAGLAAAAVSYYGLERPLSRWKGLFDRTAR